MSLLKHEGLYDPRFDRASCGVGFVADIAGRKSHDIVEKAIQAICNLDHRGACGCDPRTGDGAGILMQIPDEFLRAECESGANIVGRRGFTLPPPGDYAVGMFFLPQIPVDRHFCEGLIEEITEEEGLEFLGWRQVPVDNSVIGEFARDVEPRIKQAFVRKPRALGDQDAFERKLYVVRKRIQKVVRDGLTRAFHYFYIPSFSSRTLVYKGMLVSSQLKGYFPDLSHPDVKSAIAMVHHRFSTNTFPTWDLAHPFRYLSHNGEINTLRGNINWLSARENNVRSDLFGDDMKKILPICRSMGSDSALLDNALEFLLLGGRSLPHAMMMLVPEAWEHDENMDPQKRAFYEFHAGIMEPWDGPAAVAFSDGRSIGAVLDRNGLRPARYTVTKSGLVVMASETGVLDIPDEEIERKERLQPGRIFLIDTEERRIIDDEELKEKMAARRPYRQWLVDNKVELASLGAPPPMQTPPRGSLGELQKAFGYSTEDMKVILSSMAANGEEPIGSMGTDVPLAVLSQEPQLLYHYFKQMFAQVTNPPIDPIREEVIMSTTIYVGGEGNILDEYAAQCHQIELKTPVLTNVELDQIRHHSIRHFRTITLPALYHVEEGGKRLRYALDELRTRASNAVRSGYSILIISDRNVDAFRAPIPMLLAVGAVHQHLVREGSRTKVGIMVETGEAREVHHLALLLGYGASAVNPYLAFDTLTDMADNGLLPEGVTSEKAHANYMKALKKGLLKVMSKMGISTLFSYHGAQIFEALGLSEKIVEEFFTGTPSNIGGIGLDEIAEEARLRHRHGYQPGAFEPHGLRHEGVYQWRRGGERHLINPATIAKFQNAVRSNSFASWEDYARTMNEETQKGAILRSLIGFRKAAPVPLEEVEPATAIVKRFVTGAMSFGSISKEAHENLAIAMNRIGGRSNTGEGGEDPDRYQPLPNGDLRRSAVKQVASGRFGVTAEYLINADELQIKIAQGAKPGEGGQLPGHKVSEEIARTRHSTPGVGLISPPPHHDIYSIEDLAQLIHDLHTANPKARVSVKLVSESGIGTIAAGVSKAKADVILVSGYEGGTGASPISSIRHAGTPWEIGLSETHQVLVKNDLRSRVILQADGKLSTGRDVAIAAMLGAEEFGFATFPLIASGCIMMRKCHLNTCPVGIATQDPELRKKFTGKPEHVVNFFFLLAEDLRRIMASLGFRTVNEMVGRVDMLERIPTDHWKARHVDLSRILFRQRVPKAIATRFVHSAGTAGEECLDIEMIRLAKGALEEKKPVAASMSIRNVHRTVGAMLSGEIARRHGHKGLPADTITFRLKGAAGQSFGGWGANGLTLELEGDANDYFGKGLSGARLVVRPPANAGFRPEENIIIGNVSLYGAICGEAYIRGRAGERFAVRNSGAAAVVEGVGDHGCEYMTGGVIVVLGETGRNFAAGMSGGVAYVWNPDGAFKKLHNPDLSDLAELDAEDRTELKRLLERHLRFTGSTVAERFLAEGESVFAKFTKVFPRDYRRVLEARKAEGKALSHG